MGVYLTVKYTCLHELKQKYLGANDTEHPGPHGHCRLLPLLPVDTPECVYTLPTPPCTGLITVHATSTGRQDI